MLTKAVVILVVLVMGVESLKCHVCKEVEENDEVNEVKSVACDEASIAECNDSEDACVTATLSYTVVSVKTKQRNYVCGEKSMEGAATDLVCQSLHTKLGYRIFSQMPGFTDFECTSDYCHTDLCNASQATQISFLLLVAAIALYG